MKKGEIFDTIYVHQGEKFQVTCVVMAFDATTNTITLEPKTQVIEDIASFVSDLPVEDRSTPVITTDVPLIDDLSQIEMKLWCETYIHVGSVRYDMADARKLADEAIVAFRESFGISIEPIETPE